MTRYAADDVSHEDADRPVQYRAPPGRLVVRVRREHRNYHPLGLPAQCVAGPNRSRRDPVAVALLGFDGIEKETAEMPTTAFATAEPPGAAETALDPRGLSREAEGHPLAVPLRRYELSTTEGGEVLMRVIGLVRSRCGEIMALDFRRGDRHRPPVLDISVAIDRRHGPTLAHRLAGLIDVLAVREY